MPIDAHTAFPLYDFPELEAAHATLWSATQERARDAGLPAGRHFTQMCGYPLVHAGTMYEVIGVPRYDLPYCAGITHRAIIVVAADASYRRLDDLRRSRFALNERDSNTGMNLPRHLIAAIAGGDPFFDEVRLTGSHAASLAAIAAGHADVASIDAVTFALLAQHRPHAIAHVRMLAVTAPAPAPAFVMERSADSCSAALLVRRALAATIEDPALAPVRRALHIAGIDAASYATYDPIRKYEKAAIDAGYAVIA